MLSLPWAPWLSASMPLAGVHMRAVFTKFGTKMPQSLTMLSYLSVMVSLTMGMKLMVNKNTGQSATAGAHHGVRKDISDWLDLMTMKTTAAWILSHKLAQPVPVKPILPKCEVQLVSYTTAHIQLVQRLFNFFNL